MTDPLNLLLTIELFIGIAVYCSLILFLCWASVSLWLKSKKDRPRV